MDYGPLERLFAQPSNTDALKYIKKECKPPQRILLSDIAGIEQAWRNCDQTIHENVCDLSELLVAELYEPYQFFKCSLSGPSRATGKRRRSSQRGPRELFEQKQGTSSLKQSAGYWTAACGLKTHKWLPPPEHSFDAVVHFVQSGSGTGVHIGDGKILTCAHVVDSRDDNLEGDIKEGEGESDRRPIRTGRKKVVMFPNRRLFIAECTTVEESADGSSDVAILLLRSELAFPREASAALDVNIAIVGKEEGDVEEENSTRVKGRRARDSSAVVASSSSSFIQDLASATLAEMQLSLGRRVFCVGNPSNIDLESINMGHIEFHPPAWHCSVGQVQDGSIRNSCNNSIYHSCWTYWGHSGAPLFDEDGHVQGLHSSWDDQTGIRIGQKLENLQLAVQKTADKKRQVEVIGKEKGGGSGKGQADDCPPKKRRSRVA